MNMIRILALYPWVERLGWTLLHFIWQGLFIAVLYDAARRSMPRASSAHARYCLACAALAAMMVSPFATWEILQRSPHGLTVGRQIESAPRPLPPAALIATDATPASVSTEVSHFEPRQFLTWVVLAWLTGTMLFWVRLVGGWLLAARIRSIGLREAPWESQETLRKLGTQIGLFRPVRLLVSALVQVPLVVGWLRPVVLVPVGALGGMPPGFLETLLLHELAHIRRHDYLVNVLQSVAEALLFYHPAVWWVSGQIRVERELCCDDMVVAASGDALTYAHALAHLEFHRPAHLRTAVAASGGSLSDRIARLLGQQRPVARTGMGPGILAVAALLVTAAYGVFGQSDVRPAFQSVSIKRNTSDWSNRFQHPMGLGANASLMFLIQFAYAPHDNPMAGHSLPLPASQAIGGPSWINSEGYDIQAKPGANTDPKQWWLMWQTLLADRFKLKLHRETRELPVYVLTAAKNGLNLPAAKPADCVSFPPGTAPRHVPGKIDCGYVGGPGMGLSAGPGKGYLAGLGITGRKVRIADLARELASILDHPILDRTGFTGEFDLTLNFRPTGALAGLPPGYGSTSDPALPDIFNALEQQLGLQLTSAQSPVEVLVIDHAERPALN